jgi:hypothetical protein
VGFFSSHASRVWLREKGEDVDNRIVDVAVETRALDPARAEVWVTVTPLHVTPTTEVRGRFTGPSCPYASTIEVAYPLTPPRRPERVTPEAMQQRVLIPEPSLWDPQSPYLYAGRVELWQDGQLADRAQLHHGLRQLQLGPRGLRVNGRLLVLRGIPYESLFPEQIPALRAGGCNTLVVPLGHETLPVWDAADRYGFLVLARFGEDDRETAQLLLELRRHPSCLGWLAGAGWLKDERLERLAQALAAGKRDACGALESQPLIGIEVGHEAPRPLPQTVQFLVCQAGHEASASRIGLPLLGSLVSNDWGTGAEPPE